MRGGARAGPAEPRRPAGGGAATALPGPGPADAPVGDVAKARRPAAAGHDRRRRGGADGGVPGRGAGGRVEAIGVSDPAGDARPDRAARRAGQPGHRGRRPAGRRPPLRTETRGAHARSDFPEASDRWRRRIVHQGGRVGVLPGTVGTEHGPRARPMTAAAPGVDPSLFDPPRPAVVEAVARALAEDLLPLGDLTAALVDRLGGPRRWRWSAGPTGWWPAGACAVEAFAQVDPTLAVDWRLPDGSRVSPGSVVAVARRAAPVDPHRRADRPQLPRPPLRGGHPHPPLRGGGRGRGPRRPGPRHPQDHPGPAGPGEGGGAGRRRPQPPGQPLRGGAGQGQPPRRGHHHRGGGRGPGRCGRAGWSRSSATGRTRSTRRWRPGPPWCCSTTWPPTRRPPAWRRVRRDGPGVLVEVSGGIDPRHRPPLRRRRRRPPLGRGAHPLGPGPRPRPRPRWDAAARHAHRTPREG